MERQHSRSARDLGLTLLRWLGVGLLFACAHVAHRTADEVRFEDAELRMQLVPSPAALRAVSMGQPTMLADLMWIRSVLQFVDVFEHPSDKKVSWLFHMVQSVNVLDPQWRSAWFYGGSFMRVVGAIEESDAIFRGARAVIPDDPFFPFALGMNAYLDRDDAVEAARLIREAAEIPGAPPWYRAAAAGLIDRNGERRAALRYLRQELDTVDDPRVRVALETKITDLAHDEWVSLIAERREKTEAELGRPIGNVAELGTLPEDPFGEGWILAPDGVVRSAAVDRELARKSIRNERRFLLKKPYW